MATFTDNALNQAVWTGVRNIVGELRAVSNHGLTDKDFDEIKAKLAEVLEAIREGDIDTGSGVVL